METTQSLTWLPRWSLGQERDAAKAKSRGIVGYHTKTEGDEPMQQRCHHGLDNVPLGHLAQFAKP